MDSSYFRQCGMETDQLNKVNLDWKKYFKTDLRIKTGLSGANYYDLFVIQAQRNVYSGALAGGQPQSIHHSDYDHFIIPVQPKYYTGGIEKIGTTT